MSMGEIDEARARVRRDFGPTVARKASDAFVMLHGREPFRATRAPATVLEWGGERPASGRREDIRLLRAAFVLEAGPPLDALRAAASFSRRSDIEGAPPFLQACWLNRSVKTAADLRIIAEVADDPSITALDIPRPLRAELGTTARVVAAPEYRERHGVCGAGVILAIIDSEVAADHPGVAGRVKRQGNYTSEPWGRPEVHGTAIAGIAGNASRDFTGMSPKAMLYNYKVFATASSDPPDDFSGALALEQALEDGARVANCSWGVDRMASSGRSRVCRACDQAWALGLLVVKSAGNCGTLTSPADADGVLVVGATDRAGRAVQSYSGRGIRKDGETRPHLVAPGGTPDDQITSCVLTGGFGPSGYGTSYATAHVSGCAALIVNAHPHYGPDEVKAELLSLCRPIKESPGESQGRGLLRLI